ncbi:hypothetical protein R6Q57_024221 [Mikania cordata]
MSPSSCCFNLVPPPPPPPPPRSLSLRCYHSRPSNSTSTTTTTTLSNILNSGVIACLRAQSADVALEAARAAITGGISVLEIVVSTPGVFEVLHQLVQDFPTTTLGVGTVLNTKDAEKAKNAGAKFIMSPAIVKILSSYNAGAKIVKIYPVSAIGGAQYIATLKKPFPHIPIVVSQGITTDSVGAYIDEGASAVVLSDAIFDKKAVSLRNFSAIYELAQYAALQVNEAVKRKEKIFPGKFYENMRH